MKTSKFALKINWPLEELQAEHAMGRLKNYFDMKYAQGEL